MCKPSNIILGKGKQLGNWELWPVPFDTLKKKNQKGIIKISNMNWPGRLEWAVTEISVHY